MKVLVTGAHGRIGRALVPALIRAGHDVRATDLTRPQWDRHDDPREARDYVQADLTDAGACFVLARSCDAVVHTAAIPQPLRNPAHVVFANNIVATFNVLEAAIAGGAHRFVNFSSETVTGFAYAARAFEPDYLPIDEAHPVRPQDPYGTAKWLGEQLMERAPERADIGTVSLRPSWVQDVGSYERNLGPTVRDPAVLTPNLGSYTDVYDLVEATILAVQSDLPGHEALFVASPDAIGGHPLEELVRSHHGLKRTTIRPLPRPDASAIDSSKAQRLLGWEPQRSWRDYLDEQGRLREDAAAPW